MLLRYKAACLRKMIAHEVRCPISSNYWRGIIRAAITALAEAGF